jgi:hypothetical protein
MSPSLDNLLQGIGGDADESLSWTVASTAYVDARESLKFHSPVPSFSSLWSVMMNRLRKYTTIATGELWLIRGGSKEIQLRRRGSQPKVDSPHGPKRLN